MGSGNASRSHFSVSMVGSGVWGEAQECEAGKR
jgi:hypothetical protein